MALTITEELQVLKESEVPGGGIGPGTNPLSELVYQSAIGEAITFIGGAKNVDEGVNPDAAQYLSKMSNVARQVKAKNLNTLDTMRKILVSLIGDSAFTFAQVSGADEAAWIGFIQGEITEIFELSGGVLPHEKTEYDGL